MFCPLTIIHFPSAPRCSTYTIGYRRIEWIALALAPVKKKLGKRRYERLVSALAMCVGIEALIVLRDLRGLNESEAEDVSRWASRTLLRESLQEIDRAPRRRK